MIDMLVGVSFGLCDLADDFIFLLIPERYQLL